jgi:hypothetical protein
MVYPSTEVTGHGIDTSGDYIVFILAVVILVSFVGTCICCICYFFFASDERLIGGTNNIHELMGVNDEVRREHRRLVILSHINHKVRRLFEFASLRHTIYGLRR